MSDRVLLAVLGLSYCLLLVGSDAEMFKDPGFESPDIHSSWTARGCQMRSSTDHVEGKHSVEISSRAGARAGPGQMASLQVNTRYFVQARVKQLNDVTGKIFQKFAIIMDIQLHDGSHSYVDVVENKAMYSQKGWTSISGNFMFQETDHMTIELRVSGPDKTVNYLVDDMSLTEIPEDKNWKSEADKRIDQLRKNNIHFSVHAPPHVSTADLDIQVDLVKHSFPFGSQTRSHEMFTYPHYNDLFYYMFNWATVNDYYWFLSRQPQHDPDYGNVTKALNLLHQHGISIRGHNIFWGNARRTPAWVQGLSPDQVKQAVDERIQYIVKDTKGKLQHWDVNNELLSGHWLEEHTGDRFFTHKIFAKLHQADPSVKLFLNDAHVVARGTLTTAYVDQAKEFKSANVGLYGLGVESHFTAYKAPDPTLIKRRLDMLATTGLHLWVTEMDVVASDENTRADWYDTALRIMFSHPDVEGIILWGFWDEYHWRGPDAALVDGPQFNINAAGKRYIDLLYKEWSTHVTHRVSSGTQFNISGFHGDYRVVVKYHGNPVIQQTFTLGKQDKQVSIQITNVNHVINIPTATSPLDYHHSVPHPVTHINERTIGNMTSGSSNQLKCLTRYSGFSEVADDKKAEVGCPSGYVLTGCSGKVKDNRDQTDGEKISFHTGATCGAYEGGSPTAPLQAVARCCMLTGLKCEYRTSGPSLDVLGQRIETRCQNNMYATGCAAHTFFRLSDGTFPSAHSCIAQNFENKGGLQSSAVCCSAPYLTCRVKVSPPSGHKLGDTTSVSCDSGWHLVGCSAYSEDAKLSGAYIRGNPELCEAVNGAERLYGEMGAEAYATCCRTQL
ncbi:endo-1,4-beta-xylanase 3-like [Haliotis rufescens]|uniref:endo-1,4-beta-xylanase 3-like n=1 Tax=Haliotis rufescens TaxID=6454 RepID=UPI00201E9660|nr:endo-1,4-beta-xylanase 3-like [Haliotis rufescens]